MQSEFLSSNQILSLTESDMQHTEGLVSKPVKICYLHDILQPGRCKVGYRAKTNTEKPL